MSEQTAIVPPLNRRCGDRRRAQSAGPSLAGATTGLAITTSSEPPTAARVPVGLRNMIGRVFTARPDPSEAALAAVPLSASRGAQRESLYQQRDSLQRQTREAPAYSDSYLQFGELAARAAVDAAAVAELAGAVAAIATRLAETERGLDALCERPEADTGAGFAAAFQGRLLTLRKHQAVLISIRQGGEALLGRGAEAARLQEVARALWAAAGAQCYADLAVARQHVISTLGNS